MCRSPIGRACENTEVFALRDDGQLVGVGEEGELFVRGTGCDGRILGPAGEERRGARPEPAAGGHPRLAYRTGDLVRLRPDGEYEFLGRRDHQIKSRGYRIELGDIEAALSANPEFLESAAVAVPHPDWGTAIVAWVVPTERIGRHGAVREATRRDTAPPLHGAGHVEVVEALPRTSNGKIDRQLLIDRSTTVPVGWEDRTREVDRRSGRRACSRASSRRRRSDRAPSASSRT